MSKYKIDNQNPATTNGVGQRWRVAARPRIAYWLQALTTASNTIKHNPDDAAAYCERGNAYHNLQQYEQAIADYTQAMTLNPDNSEASKGWSVAYTCKFGLAQHNMEQYAAAAASFGSAITLAPDDATTHYLRGVCYIKLQQYDDALADFSAALEIERDYAAAYSQRGRLHVSLGSYAAGIADLDAALEIDSSDSEAYSSLADALRATANNADATANYHRASELRKEG